MKLYTDEMPKCCLDCPCCFEIEYCTLLEKGLFINVSQDRDETCPLLLLPKQQDIKIDKLKKWLKEEQGYYNKTVFKCCWYAIGRVLNQINEIDLEEDNG